MNKTIATLLALATVALLAGCNTIHGMGQDIQKAGSAVEKAADKNK
ncbi:MAG TPA: entericidin A/B family lipoprotein [Ramlibacter sp.]|jgi:predicted small secreted protein|nr:entericidin A/B family lipoprotein [Ramlibacter sp.]